MLVLILYDQNLVTKNVNVFPIPGKPLILHNTYGSLAFISNRQLRFCCQALFHKAANHQHPYKYPSK